MLFAATAASLVVTAPFARAASQTWTAATDTNWNTASSDWTNGGLWTNDGTSAAIFGSTGVGTITVSTGIQANSITFTTDGYTLSGGTITLVGIGGNITTGTGTDTIGSALGGSVGLTESGGGTLILTSTSNAYTGGTSIGAGVLQIGSASNLPSASALTFSGGGALNMTGGMTLANSVTIAGGQAGTLKMVNTTNGILTGDYSGVAGTLTLDVSGGSGYSGISVNSANGPAAGSVVNILGTTNANNVQVGTNILADQGFFANAKVSVTATGTGNTYLAFGNGAARNAQFGALDGGNATTLVGFDNESGCTVTINGTANGNFAGNIFNGFSAGALALIKNGSSTQTLSGPSSYTGTTTINAGTLTLQDTTSFASATTVNGSGTLGLVRSVAGFANRKSVNNTITGTGTINVNNTGSGITGGWTTFNSANSGLTSFTRTINVNTGVLAMDNVAGLWSNSTPTLNVVSGGLFALRVQNMPIAALTGNGDVFNSDPGNTNTLTVGSGNATGSFSGIIHGNNTGGSDGTLEGGVVAITKTGSGTQTFTGANTYTGLTTVSAGELILNPSTITSNIDISAVSIASPGTLDLNWATNSSDGWWLPGAITGSGAIIKDGAGWIDTRNAIFTNFTGSITINGGVFGNGFANDTWTNSTAAVTINSPGVFDLRGANAGPTIFASLSGGGDVVNTLAGTATLQIGAGGASSTFGGVIHGNGTGTNVPGSGTAYTSANAEAGVTVLTKIGTGTLTLTGLSTYSGGTNVQNGTLVLANNGGNTLLSTGAVTLGAASTSGILQLGNATNAATQTLASIALTGSGGSVVGGNSAVSTLTFSPAGSITLAAMLGGAGTNQNNLALTKSGAGTLTLNGSVSNTYTGGTTVSAGTLILSQTGGAVALPGDISLTNTSTANLWPTLSGELGGSGLLTFTGNTSNARFYLEGTTQSLAGINESNAVGVVENSEPSIASSPTNSGTGVLTLTGGGTYSFNGFLRNSTGTLALTDSGAGTQTLVGTNVIYNGATTINSGTLVLQDTTAFGSTATVNTNGTLQLTRSVAGFASRKSVNNIISGTGTVNVNNTGSGITGGWTIFGSATSGLNNFTGTLNVNTGVLAMDNVAGLWTNSTPTLNVVSGGLFALRVQNMPIAALTGNGDVFNSDPNNTNTLTIGSGNANGSFSGIIHGNNTGGSDGTLEGGTVAITKTGTGTQTLTGVSTYTGATTVQNGILDLANSGGSTIPATAAVTLGGTGTSGILQIGSAANIATQTLAGVALTGGGGNIVGGNSAVSTLTFSPAASISVAAALGGAGTNQNNLALFKGGAGTLTLNGGVSNTYTGGTTVSAGTLILSDTAGGALPGDISLTNTSTANLWPTLSGQLGGSGLLTFTGNTSNARFYLEGTTQSLGGINESNSVGVVENSEPGIASSPTNSGTGVLTLTGGGTYSFNGFLRNSTGTLALTDSGAGTQTLSGTNIIYTGSTTLNSGTLVLKDTTAFGSTATVNTNGTLQLTRSVAGFASRASVNNIISGTGTVNVNNTGSGITGGWTIFGSSTSGVNNFTGTLNVNSGVLAMDNVGGLWTSSTPTVNVVSGGIFAIRAQSFTIGALTGNGDVANTNTTNGAAGETLTVGGGNASGSFSGIIHGSIASGGTDGALDLGITNLAKTGSGTQTLTGVNTYTGATAVNGGTLLISNTGSLASGSAVTVQSTGALGGNGTINGTVSLSGALNLTTGSTGTLTLNNGLTTLNNSSLNFALGASGIAETFNVAGGSLTVGATTFINITGSANMTSGTYTLATFPAGTNTTTLNSNFSLGTPVVNGWNLSINAVTGVEQLKVTAGSNAYWQGTANDNLWSDGGNWTSDQVGNNPTSAPGSPLNLIDVYFVGDGYTSSFPTTVTLDTAGLDVHSLNFTSAASNLTIGGGNSLQIESGGITVASGSGSAGANSIATTGSVIVNATQIWSNNSSTLFTVSSNITGPATGSGTTTLNLGGAGTGGITLSGAISDGSAQKIALGINSGGTVTLTSNNTYSGGTTITSGTLQVGIGSAAGSLGSGTIVDNSVLAYDRPDSVTISTISGNGAFNQIGTGTITLSSANVTYNGATTVSSGTLALQDTTAFASPITLTGTTLDLTRGTVGFGNRKSINNTITGSGTININNTGSGLAGGWTTFNGATSGVTGFTGTINVNTGVLAMDNVAGLWTNSTPTVNVISGGVFAIRAQSFTIGALTGNGDVANTNTTNGAAGETLTVGGANASGTFSGTIHGSIASGGTDGTIDLGITNLTKTGTGTQILSGTNTYSGATTISQGVLQLNNSLAVQNSIVTISATNGLAFGPGLSPFTIPGLSGSSNDKLAATDNSAVTLLVGNNTTASTYSGALTNIGGVTKTGSAMFTLSGGSNYTGATLINTGTLALQNTTSFASPITVNSGTTLLFNNTAAGVQSSTAATINLQGTLSYAATTASYWVWDAPVTANATSIINVTATGGVAGNSGLYLDGGLDGSAQVTVNNNTNGVGLVLRDNNSTFSGTLIVNGNATGVASTESGLCVSGTPTSLATANITVNGTLELGGANSAGGASGSGIGWAASNANGLNFAMNSLNGTGAIVGNMITASSTRSISVGSNNGSGTFSGVISNGSNDTLSFTKTGSGTQTLSGVNTYTGTTTVNAGTLSLVSPGSLGNTAVTVSGAGTLSGTGTINNSGSNVVSINSGGTISPATPTTVGTLSTGSQTWNAGTDIFKTTTSTTASNATAASLTGGSSQDFIVINGNLNIVTGVSTPTPFNISIVSLDAPGTIPASNASYTIAYASNVYTETVVNGTPVQVTGSSFAFPTADFVVTDNNVGGFAYNVSAVSDPTGPGGAGGYDIVVTVAPEPSSLGLLGLASLGLLRRRRSARDARTR